MALHHAARGGRFFDDDAGRVAQRVQHLQHVRHRQAFAGRWRRCGRTGFTCRRQRPGAWRRPGQQIEQAQADAAQHRQPLRRPGRNLRILDQLHQRRTGRHMRALPLDVIGESRRTDGKDQVMPGQQLHDALTHRGQEAGEEAVVFRKAAAARHRRHEDARVVALGQRDSGVPGAVAVHGGADDKRRALGRIQCITQLRQQPGLGPQFGADLAQGHGLAQLRPVIRWNRHQHRPARRHHGQVISARDGQRHILRPRRLHAPLDIRLGQLGGLRAVQKRIERQDGSRLLPGRDDHGRAVLVCREDVAHCMAHTSGRMQVDEAGLARGLRVTVGHAHDHGFLQAQHVAKVGREIQEQRQFGGTGVAEDGGQADRAQKGQRGFAHGRGWSLLLRRSHRRSVTAHTGWLNTMKRAANPSPITPAQL